MFANRVFYISFLCSVLGSTGKAQQATFQKGAAAIYSPTIPVRIYPTTNELSGQKVVNKPVLNSAALKHWIHLEDNNLAISNNGNYFWYKIRNQPYGSSTLIIQSLIDPWKVELIGIGDGFFSGDSKQFVYLDRDTLVFLKLGSKERVLVQDISSYRPPQVNSGQWMSYQLKGEKKTLVIHNLINGCDYLYDHVVKYDFDERTTALVLQTDNLPGKASGNLQWFNVANDNIKPVWSWGVNVPLLNFKVDVLRKQLCWLIFDTIKNTPNYSILYYRLGMGKPLEAVNSKTRGIEAGVALTAAASPGFTKDGRYIHFWMNEAESPKANPNAVQVDIWNYRDTELQSIQLMRKAKGETSNKYQAVVAVDLINSTVPGKVVQILRDNEDAPTGYASEINGDYFLAREKQGGDRFWENQYKYWLVNLKEGIRKLIYTADQAEAYFWFSPNGRYLLQYRDDRNYYSYDLQTSNIRNISSVVKANLNLENPFYVDSNGNYVTSPVGLAGWLKNEYVLVNDNYDIWQLDLAGKQSPINITHAYGLRNQLKIRVIDEGTAFQEGDTILLTVFDPLNKFNGLFREVLGSRNAFEKPMMGPWSIYYSSSKNHSGTHILNQLMRPIKARDANAWVVKRESVKEAPNYFLTHDFKTYQPLTHLQPQVDYNWLQSELLRWTKADGSRAQGVLYKPENFDVQKKYPLLIWLYEQKSGYLHQFPTPDFLRSTEINIAWFVSHGYLVFTPDMYYTKEKMIESACSTIISAGKSLSLLSYIDGQRMGIAGFSWGGVQINWLVTQTDLFAAAATGGTGAAGSDLISAAFQISEIKGVKQESITGKIEETLGGSFWSNPSRWLTLSPVLRCDKVKTPLLMLQNYGDFNWQLTAELFLGLRRLNKPVWMLQYDNGHHGVMGKDAEDFTIRITQFFDHFLKGTPMPRWMSKGIPAKLKGVETGYEIDE